MNRRKPTRITNVELEFMHVLWCLGKATPEDIQKSLSNNGKILSGGSIRKILMILMKKGYVGREKLGKGHIYHAIIGQELTNKNIVNDLINHAFGGSASLMVSTLLGSDEISDEDLEKIEKLIAQRKTEKKK